MAATGLTTLRGAVWSTDAPFRETTQAISAAVEDNLLAVERKLPRFMRLPMRDKCGSFVWHT